MAEAVAGLATAASALQLADVGLRWGKEIYNLLSDIKHAPQEVHNLRNTVDDVNSVIRNLSRYIAEFNQSASTRAEHNVLPEAVTRAVQGFHEQLATLKGLLPTESVQQKIRWGLDKKRKVKEVTENLGRRKTTVLLALEIDGRWADIKKRDDIRNLADTLTATSQAARESHASSFNAVNSELATIRGSGQRIEASQAQSHRVLQGIRDHTSSLGTVTSELGTIRGSAHRIEASQAQAHDLIQGIGDRLPLADGAIHDKLDSLISIFTGFQLSPEQSLSTTSAYNVGSEETLGRVFRAELRRVLIPALDQSLGSFSGKDAVLRDVRRTDDLVSGKMSEAVMFQKPAACEKGQTQPPLATLACTNLWTKA
ncbi:MAG: hypothetical protein M1815_005081 [Lichina confinis]|nr:MAG: hypothetical protein M1815_005081 [Lichina confinis]